MRFDELPEDFFGVIQRLRTRKLYSIGELLAGYCGHVAGDAGEWEETEIESGE